MKRSCVFLIVVFIVFSACGGFAQGLSPPAWILGTWADEFGANTWVFSEKNALYRVWARYTDGSVTTIDFAEGNRLDGVSVFDEATSSAYVMTVREGSVEMQLRFVRTSDGNLESYRIEDEATEGPIILLKQ